MSDKQYQIAIDKAKLFIEAAEAAKAIRYESPVTDKDVGMMTGTKECGEAKRRSMDLTRQLAKFRNGEA